MKQLLLAFGATLCVYAHADALPASETNTGNYKFFQTRKIDGKVTNDKGEPLSGVTVTVKGSTTSTITGTNGEFSIHVLNNPALIQNDGY